ncbi:MAG: hypothetical protein IKY67_06755 [Paludibacteraceae bacterium]|nr:hypothetical protein [Paludibacteraceae bacterium]
MIYSNYSNHRLQYLTKSELVSHVINLRNALDAKDEIIKDLQKQIKELTGAIKGKDNGLANS